MIKQAAVCIVLEFRSSAVAMILDAKPLDLGADKRLNSGYDFER
ncbi:hypothetical protein PC116_g28703 [Phytophthora cactorum]|nr:hypothetical protein PC116_g28703 [Phytophthora cactorum]